VEGLQPVDVILRRVDDSFCDPLDLRGDSFLGVAGLVDAVNAGNVVVANALGSGVIETAAIMPFLPGLPPNCWESRSNCRPSPPGGAVRNTRSIGC
jgi:uncharacterized circularly permuted ATP-grasp superfamily protein